MLDAFAQVELMIAGLHVETRAAGNVPILSVLDEQPDAPAAKAYRGEPVLGLEFNSPEFTDYVVGRWAATGADAWLRELVRRARHRDGSSAAISASLYGLDILRSACEGDPIFVPKLQAMGFDPNAVRFGAIDSTVLVDGEFDQVMRADLIASRSKSLDEAREMGLAMPEPEPVATRPFIPAPAASPVMAAVDVAPPVTLRLVPNPGARANDVDSINVEGSDGRVTVDFDFPDARTPIGFDLSLDLADRLANDIQAALWPLLIPAEGFTWDDDISSGISFLCVVDDVLASEKFSDAEKFGDPEAPFYPHPGRVVGRVLPHTGAGFGGQFGLDQHVKSDPSLLVVKCAVAKLAREFLAQPVAG